MAFDFTPSLYDRGGSYVGVPVREDPDAMISAVSSAIVGEERWLPPRGQMYRRFLHPTLPPWRGALSNAVASSKQQLFTLYKNRWVHEYCEYALEVVLLNQIQKTKRDSWFLNALEMTLFWRRFLHLCFVLWISHRLFLCDSSSYIGMLFGVVGLLHLMYGNVNAFVILARVSTWLFFFCCFRPVYSVSIQCRLACESQVWLVGGFFVDVLCFTYGKWLESKW
jgi:hypothetical protein